ncbi:MAG: nuclear transport factor 2 family protein [Steroidobacteraceae bacterium]
MRDFNAAISARRLDAALALIAPGAVNFNLHAAHGGAAGEAPPPLTSDLGVHWRTVTPILFGQTRAFRRELRALSTQVDGELASCWAQVETTTEPRAAGAPPVRRSVAESYLLRREGAQWRIVAMASSRAAR